MPLLCTRSSLEIRNGTSLRGMFWHKLSLSFGAHHHTSMSWQLTFLLHPCRQHNVLVLGYVCFLLMQQAAESTLLAAAVVIQAAMILTTTLIANASVTCCCLLLNSMTASLIILFDKSLHSMPPSTESNGTCCCLLLNSMTASLIILFDKSLRSMPPSTELNGTKPNQEGEILCWLKILQIMAAAKLSMLIPEAAPPSIGN
jgi:hypothetical protein